MLVYVRPSNEALLRARVPGAQDQCGWPSHPSDRARSASKKGTWQLPFPLPRSLALSQGWGLIDLPLRATFSPAHPLARRDVPLTRARAF